MRRPRRTRRSGCIRRLPSLVTPAAATAGEPRSTPGAGSPPTLPTEAGENPGCVHRRLRDSRPPPDGGPYSAYDVCNPRTTGRTEAKRRRGGDDARPRCVRYRGGLARRRRRLEHRRSAGPGAARVPARARLAPTRARGRRLGARRRDDPRRVLAVGQPVRSRAVGRSAGGGRCRRGARHDPRPADDVVYPTPVEDVLCALADGAATAREAGIAPGPAGAPRTLLRRAPLRGGDPGGRPVLARLRGPRRRARRVDRARRALRHPAVRGCC